MKYKFNRMRMPGWMNKNLTVEHIEKTEANGQYFTGNTLLHYFAMADYTYLDESESDHLKFCVNYLVGERGVFPNKQNKDGNTALHVAVLYEQGCDMIRYIGKYTDVNIKNNEKHTAYELYIRKLLKILYPQLTGTYIYQSGTIPKELIRNVDFDTWAMLTEFLCLGAGIEKCDNWMPDWVYNSSSLPIVEVLEHLKFNGTSIIDSPVPSLDNLFNTKLSLEERISN